MSTIRSHDPQPAPIPDSGASVTDAAIAFLQERREFGRRKYGTELCANNGRDALLDLRDELADALLYATQEIAERDERIAAAVAAGRRDAVRAMIKTVWNQPQPWILWATPNDPSAIRAMIAEMRPGDNSPEIVAANIKTVFGLTISTDEIAAALADESEVAK